MGISVLITTYMTDSVFFNSPRLCLIHHTLFHTIYAKWKLYWRFTISMSKSQKMETKGIIYTIFVGFCFILFFFCLILFSKSNDENHFNMSMNIQKNGKTMQFIKIYYQKKHATIWTASGTHSQHCIICAL